MSNHEGWQSRLGFSVVFAVALVVISTLLVLFLSSPQRSPGTGAGSEKGSDMVFDIVGLPLAPGWLVVSQAFGEWRAVHQGQIAFIPFISVGMDALIIFAVWEFFHRRKSRDLASDDMPHILG